MWIHANEGGAIPSGPGLDTKTAIAPHKEGLCVGSSLVCFLYFIVSFPNSFMDFFLLRATIKLSLIVYIHNVLHTLPLNCMLNNL